MIDRVCRTLLWLAEGNALSVYSGSRASQIGDAVMETAGTPSQEQAASGNTAQSQRPESSRPAASIPSQADEKRAAARDAVAGLSREHVEQVARLLGWQRMSDLACNRVASVAMLLVECTPQHRELLLTALDCELQRCAVPTH